MEFKKPTNSQARSRLSASLSYSTAIGCGEGLAVNQMDTGEHLPSGWMFLDITQAGLAWQT
jgi:hypothetical protein